MTPADIDCRRTCVVATTANVLIGRPIAKASRRTYVLRGARDGSAKQACIFVTFVIGGGYAITSHSHKKPLARGI